MPIIGPNVSLIDALMGTPGGTSVMDFSENPFQPASPQPPSPGASTSPIGAAISSSPAVQAGPPAPQGPMMGPERPTWGQNHPKAAQFLGNLPAALSTLEQPPLTPYPRNNLVDILGGFGGGFVRGQEAIDKKQVGDVRRALGSSPSTKAALDAIISGDPAAIEKLTPAQLTTIKMVYGLEPENLSGGEKRQGARIAANLQTGAEQDTQRGFMGQQAGAERESNEYLARMNRMLQERGLEMNADYQNRSLAEIKRNNEAQHAADMARITSTENIASAQNEAQLNAVKQQGINNLDHARTQSIVDILSLGVDAPTASAWTKMVNNVYKGAQNPMHDLSPEEIAAAKGLPNAALIRAQAAAARAINVQDTAIIHFENLAIQEYGGYANVPDQVRVKLGTLKLLGRKPYDALGPTEREAIGKAWDYFLEEYPTAVGDVDFLRAVTTGNWDAAFNKPNPTHGPNYQKPGATVKSHAETGATRNRAAVQADIDTTMATVQAAGRATPEDNEKLRRLKAERDAATE